MAQEEQNQRYSNSSSGGGCGIKSSKKLKQKKIPQRGLGVAQLEKIRLEEQQIKDAASSILSSPSTVSPNNNSSYLSVPPLPNYKHNQSSSLVPFPPSSSLDVSLPNSLVRSSPSNTVPLTNPSNCVGLGTGWPSIPVKGRGNIPKLWNCEYNLDGENQNIDPGFAFRTNIPYEDNPIWPLPNVIQRTPQYQRSSSMVISSATSSLQNIHMEPPSNQSYYGNYTPLWPEEEKESTEEEGIIRSSGLAQQHPFYSFFPPAKSQIYHSTSSYKYCNGEIGESVDLNLKL